MNILVSCLVCGRQVPKDSCPYGISLLFQHQPPKEISFICSIPCANQYLASPRTLSTSSPNPAQTPPPSPAQPADAPTEPPGSAAAEPPISPPIHGRPAPPPSKPPLPG